MLRKDLIPSEEELSMEGEEGKDALEHILDLNSTEDDGFSINKWREALTYAFEEEDEESQSRMYGMLTDKQKGTLQQCINDGPIEDGDIESKSDRDDLISLWLISKIMVKGEEGFQAANARGYKIYRRHVESYEKDDD